MTRALGVISLWIWIVALIVGTVARFTYTWEPLNDGIAGCRFADPGSMRIACEGFTGADFVGFLFTVAWYWTWGIWWLIVEIPYSWPYLFPAIGTLLLAFKYLAGRREDEDESQQPD